MKVFYTLFIRLYGLFASLAARFNGKARLFVAGRRDWAARLEADLSGREPVIWFHAASLGEFEQGRPVMERVRNTYPDHRVLLTFFSPSGYEVRKDFGRVDWVHYLPMDTPKNARRFLDIVRPRLAVFIRYEFWHNFFREMARREIPVVVVSAVFRKGQIFFKPYGTWPRNTLRRVSHFFVQDPESRSLLDSIGVRRHSLSGDSRFDRVLEAARERREFPLVETFLGGRTCLMAGSTWPHDDRLLRSLLPEFPALKFVIVPHHVDPKNVRRVLDLFGDRAALYTRGDAQDLERRQVLVVDTLGMLTYLYRLADLTYVGDGFGGGIHSILEPAAFGMPIFFGPRYHAFREAVDLVERKGVFPVMNRQELADGIRRFLDDPKAREKVGRICRDYVQERSGVTEKVLEGLKPFLAGPGPGRGA
jgi:3-deoxy-D-manno-octulosonic-acid transferase